MSVDQFEGLQAMVEGGLPILSKLEEVILIAIEIDRADSGQLEIRLLQIQMTIMSSRLVLTEADAGMRDYGDAWVTEERADNVAKAITDSVAVIKEFDSDESMNNLIEAADTTYQERENA